MDIHRSSPRPFIFQRVLQWILIVSTFWDRQGVSTPLQLQVRKSLTGNNGVPVKIYPYGNLILYMV